MRTKILRVVGLIMALAALGTVCMTGSFGQQAGAGLSVLTTNWVGCLVVGKADALDKMGGVFPQTDRRVQIGLRSDGIVIWRDAKGS